MPWKTVCLGLLVLSFSWFGCWPPPTDPGLINPPELTATIELPAGDQVKVGELVNVLVSIAGGIPPYQGMFAGGSDQYYLFTCGQGGSFGYEHQNDEVIEVSEAGCFSGGHDRQEPFYLRVQFKMLGPAQIKLEIRDSNQAIATDQVAVTVIP